MKVYVDTNVLVILFAIAKVLSRRPRSFLLMVIWKNMN